jgi:hypothetical protein
MSVGGWLVSQLSRGGPLPAADPDEPVEIGVVPDGEGPMAVTRLEDEGLPVWPVPARSSMFPGGRPVGTPVVVRRQDATAARAVLVDGGFHLRYSLFS